MRVRQSSSGLSVHAVSGTYVVLLGIDLAETKSKGLLGFAIQRARTDGPMQWLQATRIFPFAAADVGVGQSVDTNQHPIQDFLWSDFTAAPGLDYTYRIVALKGDPKKPTEGPSVTVQIATESPEGGDHDVYFNRGAAASQQYAKEFHNQSPEKAGPPAWDWLSRGLVESIRDYIVQAEGDDWGLRVAAYEFTYPPVLDWLRKSAQSGADVRIVYHARERTSEEHDKAGKVKLDKQGHAILTQAGKNRQAVLAAKIDKLCSERQAKTTSDISHNKFIVLLKKGKPIAVLSGSTNFTEGGIFGHSNVAHIVQDPKVAKAYLDYWNQLATDPETAAFAPLLTGACDLSGVPPKGTTLVCSPRSTADALDYYARIGKKAAQGLFMTFAFGMAETFQAIYRDGTAPLRYALMEKLVLPQKDKVKEEAERQKLITLRKQVENVFAVGAFLPTNAFDLWVQEKLTGLNPQVRYLHTKYMLVDPLGEDPIVVTGSANFSKSSCIANDENMLVIRGNTRVADIYLGEFMRLHRHHAFREWASSHPELLSHPEHEYLDPTDGWAKRFFKDTKEARRRMFFA